MLYGVVLDRGEDGTDFLAVSAVSEANARAIVEETYVADPVEIVPLEELLADQYEGLARLGTA